MNKRYKVYKYTAPNGKIYIGQTCQSIKRRAGGNGIGYIETPLFYKAIQKYGYDNFTVEIIADCLTLQEANWLEIYLIAYYHSYERKHGYNLSLGGGGILGYSSPEKSAKISKAKKGHKVSEETREKLSIASKWKKRKVEDIEKTAKWHRGKKRSEKTKKNISESLHKLYNTPDGKKMASERVWCRKAVVREDGIKFDCMKDAALSVGVEPSTFRKAVKDGRTTGGYHWRYVDTVVEDTVTKTNEL